MISGNITDSLEAVVSLTVSNRDGRSQEVEAIIDTGFTGYLTLPSSTIESLGLPWLCREQGMLADGRLHIFDVFSATLVWDDLERIVEVEAADVEPLIGMSLLAGNKVMLEVRAGGNLTIERLA
jgi:clan AA aspartic protease